MSIPLTVIEDIIDASGAAPRIQTLLPACVRDRQLTARTLLIGMQITLADGRPAQLTRVHTALTGLPEADQIRLGVLAQWKTGPHQLTYRQVEHTFGLVVKALGKDKPDGAPSPRLQAACDSLLEASIPGQYTGPSSPQASASLAADWTDVESWSRPPRRGTSQCADPEASWGHRTSNLPGPKGEMYFGYYLSALTMVAEENGPAVPELARRMTLCSCALDPARALAPVLTAMPAAGIPLGDILADSGYAHRDAAAWAIPLRRAGAQLVQDLHPHDRGPRGTHQGAIIANGNLYCPATPRPLLELAPLPPGAPAGDTAAHDAQAAELARHKLGRHTADDADGYHRLTCPATAGKIRCPHRPESMKLPRDRPEILTPPGHPPACCTQQTITIGPDIAAKTAQKHDYPSPAWRRSYQRRTAAERGFSTIKDTATTSTARGWCRLMGLAPLTLWIACLLAVRNQRILRASDARQAGNARLPPLASRRPAGNAAPRSQRCPQRRHNQAARSPRRGPPAGHTPQPATTVAHGRTHSDRTARPRNPSRDHFSADAGMSVPDVNMDTGEV
jgi:hypothetical protein